MSGRSSASPLISAIAAWVWRLTRPGIRTCSPSVDVRGAAIAAPYRRSREDVADASATDDDGVIGEDLPRRVYGNHPPSVDHCVHVFRHSTAPGIKKALPKQGFQINAPRTYGFGFGSGFGFGLRAGLRLRLRLRLRLGLRLGQRLGAAHDFNRYPTVRRQTLDQLLALHLVVAELGHRDRLLERLAFPEDQLLVDALARRCSP